MNVCEQYVKNLNLTQFTKEQYAKIRKSKYWLKQYVTIKSSIYYSKGFYECVLSAQEKSCVGNKKPILKE